MPFDQFSIEAIGRENACRNIQRKRVEIGTALSQNTLANDEGGR